MMPIVILRVWEAVFWFSLFIIVYSYTLYPLLLFISVRMFGKPVRQDSGFMPAIGVLVPAHNEELVIRKKIENILAINYPHDKLSVWVGSDCSTDATEEIVEQFGDPRVHLWRAPSRGGKTGILNRLAPQIDAEILMFTDANTMHHRECLTAVVRNFADERVGAVAGHIRHALAGDEEAGEEMYRSFESRQKYLEGTLHSTISAFGGFYTIRKNLFRPIPDNAYSNDDVLIPMNIIRQGYRVVFEPEAVSEEETSGDFKGEFKRRIRIGAGNFQAFSWLLDFIIPFRGWPSFCLISHKFTRWFSPLFLVSAAVSLVVLFFWSGLDIYRMLFATGSVGVLIGLLHKVIRLRISQHIFYFLSMNIALLLGLVRFFSGIRSAVWSRTERSV